MLTNLINAVLLSIAPFKTTINQQNGKAINFEMNDVWQQYETSVSKTKIKYLHPSLYEDEVIKIETLSYVEFYQSEGEQNQELKAETWTRITPKIELATVDYYTNTYQNLTWENQYNQITTTKSARLDLYTDRQDNSQKIIAYNAIFQANSYSAVDFYTASNLAEISANKWDNYTGADAFAYYGGNEHQYYDAQTPLIIIESLYSLNDYPTWSADFEDYIVWEFNTNFLYGSPNRVNITYTWAVDPTQNPSEYIDVGDLLLTILAMPMAWIGIAFNFTLWPGTAYALNVAHVLAAIIIGGIIIVIIKKVFK